MRKELVVIFFLSIVNCNLDLNPVFFTWMCSYRVMVRA